MLRNWNRGALALAAGCAGLALTGLPAHAASTTTVTGARLHFDGVQSGCPTTSSYDSASDTSLEVGYNNFPPGDCGSAASTDYAYYVVSVPSQIWGKQIDSAAIDVQEAYTTSCTATAPVTLSWTGGINASTDWDNAPGAIQNVATDQLGPNPQSCDTTYDASPSAWLGAGFNVTSVITKAAAGDWTTFTFRIWEQGNPSDTAFKRFGENPYLTVTYG
jgi:hypothetical protein